MRSLFCFLLVLGVSLLVNCSAALEGTEPNGAGSIQLTREDAPRFLSIDGGRRFLRGDDTAEEGEESEMRGLVPSKVKAALQKKVSAHNLNEIRISWVKKLKRWFRIISSAFKERLNPRQFRFAVWIANKRTPAMIYDKLGVRYTTGWGDKNYRTYVNYLRFYEHFKGPADNPLARYGPKVDVDYKMVWRPGRLDS